MKVFDVFLKPYLVIYQLSSIRRYRWESESENWSVNGFTKKKVEIVIVAVYAPEHMKECSYIPTVVA